MANMTGNNMMTLMLLGASVVNGLAITTKDRPPPPWAYAPTRAAATRAATATTLSLVAAPSTVTMAAPPPTKAKGTSAAPGPEVAPAAGPVLPAVWQPGVGTKFQISLSKRLDGSMPWNAKSDKFKPGSAEVFDLDLFDTPRWTIQRLHSEGKKVICYFSAGSSESWRSDYKELQQNDMGAPLKDWPQEKWLDLRSENVWNIMKKRITLAKEKGCDGIDADNVDAYADDTKKGGGFSSPLKADDSVKFINRMADEGHKLGLAVGLKNAEGILPKVSKVIEFAVNEQCATYEGGCRSYERFLNGGKPVFHIEYAEYVQNGTKIDLKAEEGSRVSSMTSDELHSLYCLKTGIGNRRWLSGETAKKFSTVIKKMDLSHWVMYCDGTWEAEKSIYLDEI